MDIVNNNEMNLIFLKDSDLYIDLLNALSMYTLIVLYSDFNTQISTIESYQQTTLPC